MSVLVRFKDDEVCPCPMYVAEAGPGEHERWAETRGRPVLIGKVIPAEKVWPHACDADTRWEMLEVDGKPWPFKSTACRHVLEMGD